MSIVALIIILLFLAAISWFVNTQFAGMNPTIKLIINIVVIAIAIIVCLAAFGIWDEVRGAKVPRI